jgi:hypothetical protein
MHAAAPVSIRRAKRLIYLENQYLTSPIIVEALAERLAEPDGPEVVTVGPARSPSYFDQMTMDSARTSAINRLREVDVHKRFSAFSAHTPKGAPIIVHSKVAIMDDWMLRIGSANLNNRSIGLDSECDLAFEGHSELERETIRAFLGRLVGHFLDRRDGRRAGGDRARGRPGRGDQRAGRQGRPAAPAAACAVRKLTRRSEVHRRLEPGRRHRAGRRLAALGPTRAPQARPRQADRAAAGSCRSTFSRDLQLDHQRQVVRGDPGAPIVGRADAARLQALGQEDVVDAHEREAGGKGRRSPALPAGAGRLGVAQAVRSIR